MNWGLSLCWGQPRCQHLYTVHSRMALCMCLEGRMWPWGRAKLGTLPLGWCVCVLDSGGSAGQRFLLGRCLFMARWFD